MKKIEQTILSYKVVADKEDTAVAVTIDVMHEGVARDDVLIGLTYKVKTPMSDHAMYITINDMVLNEGTKHETRHPYEIFINSKNMEHFQWVLALTRLVSAVWRKGGNTTFLIEELKGVFDPKGGYFKKGGVFMPSIVAEIGYVIEQHLTAIGIVKPVMDEHQAEFITKKREELGLKEPTDYPESARVCFKCNTKAVIRMDGCDTCLQCADSKCG